MPKRIDLTGQRFGRLTVLHFDHNDGHGCAMWKCICDCGRETIVAAGNLRSGSVKSCGCLKMDLLKSHFCKHGRYKERLYQVWASIKTRCYNTHDPNFKLYGSRGISMCDEWRHDYAAFRDWAMANGYDPDAPRGQCTIDRIDNDGNYEPSNCRWVSMAVQAQNKRKKGTCSSKPKEVTA